MSAVHFSSPGLFHLLWAIPLLGLLMFWSWRAGTRDLRRITLLEGSLSTVDPRRRMRKWGVLLTALFFLVLGLTRPGWNPGPVSVTQRGRDVVFVVDVSRSMLAEDLVPNRLERSKLAILDALKVIQGDRVALVAFAGYPTVLCPLTQDYHFFRWSVENLSPDSVHTGGTMIGDAIRKVTEDIFDPLEVKFKDIVLISDGEDHDSFPVEAAEAAGQQGIRLIAIGLGGTAGSRIPINGEDGEREYLRYEGREVYTKLQPDTLRTMAESTPGGRYLNVETGALDMSAIYENLILSEEGKEIRVMETVRYREKFQIFLIVALALLLWEPFLREERAIGRKHA